MVTVEDYDHVGVSDDRKFIFFYVYCSQVLCVFFFFNDTATTEIYTLSLHDALPIWHKRIFSLGTRVFSL